MDLKNENEITLRDIASDDEDLYKDEKFDENPSEEEDEEMKEIDNLHEFWLENEKQKEEVVRGKNVHVDERLEEYLRAHSQQLSLHVQSYLSKVEKGIEVPANERISNLGIMAFERA